MQSMRDGEKNKDIRQISIDLILETRKICHGEAMSEATISIYHVEKKY